jgi:peptidoglycan/LPS O-acetylase OafA/YrhL
MGTAAARMRPHGNGFGGLRLALAGGIVAFHSVTLTHGGGDAMPLFAQAAARLILPAFFALSGFLVAGSLARAESLREFLLLRLIRLLPALSLVVAMTALVLGPLLTDLSWRDYFRDPLLPDYFRNVWGQPQYALPGLFLHNPRAGIVNGALWTIPLEAACYVVLAGSMLLSGLKQLVPVAMACVLLVPGLGLPNQDFFASFALGVLLYRLGDRLIRHPLLGLGAVAAALFVEYRFAYTPLVAVPLAYGVIWLGCLRIPPWMTRADYSYGLYLCAYPLQQALVTAMPAQGWLGNLMTGWFLGLGAAMLLWHGVEAPILTRKHELIARLGGRLVRA